MNFLYFLPIFLFLVSCNTPPEAELTKRPKDERFLTYTVNPREVDLRFFWKHSDSTRYGSLGRLQEAMSLRGDTLLFAVNGGMYNKSFIPQGLYVEAGKLLTPLDTISDGYGNFYLQPNGVLGLLKDGQPIISVTDSFALSPDLQYATQSGPMLVIDGALHPAFNDGSPNVNIRNGVGLLLDGELLFAMSKEKINFFDFATFFKNQGCKQALYLDGFVSRTWLPEQNWRQADGDFGVIIGVSSPK